MPIKFLTSKCLVSFHLGNDVVLHWLMPSTGSFRCPGGARFLDAVLSSWRTGGQSKISDPWAIQSKSSELTRPNGCGSKYLHLLSIMRALITSHPRGTLHHDACFRPFPGPRFGDITAPIPSRATILTACPKAQLQVRKRHHVLRAFFTYQINPS